MIERIFENGVLVGMVLTLLLGISLYAIYLGGTHLGWWKK